MIIRKSDITKDAKQIVDGMRDFAEQVNFKSLLPDDKNGIPILGDLLSLDGVELWVAEHDDQIIGMLAILYVPYQWNRQLLSAEELFWWVSKDAPFSTAYKLISKVMQEIDKKQALPVFRKLTTSPDGVDKIYHKFGLRPIETVYARL